MEELQIHICDCNSFEHMAIFWYDEEEKTLHVHTHLITYKGFWKRLWVGLKYAFGYKSRYGEWDDFLFKPEDLAKLREFLKTKEEK